MQPGFDINLVYPGYDYKKRHVQCRRGATLIRDMSSVAGAGVTLIRDMSGVAGI